MIHTGIAHLSLDDLGSSLGDVNNRQREEAETLQRQLQALQSRNQQLTEELARHAEQVGTCPRACVCDVWAREGVVADRPVG